MLGDEVSELDSIAWSFVCVIYNMPFRSGVKDSILTNNLLKYYKRLKLEFWPDWEKEVQMRKSIKPIR